VVIIIGVGPIQYLVHRARYVFVVDDLLSAIKVELYDITYWAKYLVVTIVPEIEFPVLVVI
jgi:hypothetical protein